MGETMTPWQEEQYCEDNNDNNDHRNNNTAITANGKDNKHQRHQARISLEEGDGGSDDNVRGWHLWEGQ